jgi:hypothetical protein
MGMLSGITKQMSEISFSAPSTLGAPSLSAADAGAQLFQTLQVFKLFFNQKAARRRLTALTG